MKCKIEILDDAVMCPLCHRVLEREEGAELQEEDAVNTTDEHHHGSHSVSYPDVEPAMRKMRFITKIVVFASVVLEIAALLVNYIIDFDIKWSLISGAALAYGCFTLIYSAEKTKSLQKKLVVQTLWALVLIFVIDLSLDFFGWSLSFGMPCLILGMDIAIFVLMRVDTVNWQNYIMAQIWIFGLSLACAIPVILGIPKFPWLAIIAPVVSAFSLIGTIVFGDKQAENEIKRRFHV